MYASDVVVLEMTCLLSGWAGAKQVRLHASVLPVLPGVLPSYSAGL
jgi:hypothetical protein